MATDELEMECMACGKMFGRVWFEISRTHERVHFKSPNALDEVEISFDEDVGVYCSRACLDKSRIAVMKHQGVPIPPVRPGIGPIEPCAKCSEPVDMSDWHLTFAESEIEDRRHSHSVLDFDYLAVVCKQCSPSRLAGAASANAEAERPTAAACEGVQNR